MIRGMLTALAEDLWVYDQPLRFYGIGVGTRMTVVRLADGALWLHSPVRPTPELRAAVDAIGPVRWLVAPNRWHHLYVGHWQDAYPGAAAYGAPGLQKKRKDLQLAGILDDTAPAGWAGQIDQVLRQGAPIMSEVVFLHRKSRTLVVSDTAHNFADDVGGGTKVVFSLLGGWRGFRTTIADRMVTRDRAAARASLERMLAWDFDRIVVCHGQVLPSGGKEALARAYGWLLDGKA
jgi:hypothetical protein